MPDDLDRQAPDVPSPTPDASPQPPPPEPADDAQPPSRHPWRIALVALGVIALLGISLAFKPVRTLAGQMLSVFRVKNIATISITPDDLEQIGSALERGDAHVSLEELGDVWIDGNPGLAAQEATLTTLAAAQSAVDFPVVVPTGIEGTQSVALQPGASVKFRLHVDKVNALLRHYGAEKLFSKSVDNKTFEIKMAPTVYVAYGKEELGFESASDRPRGDGDAIGVGPDSESQDVVIVQTRGPELVVPDGVNPLELREVVLGLPFLPENVRTQLQGVTDWQNTLLIPNVSGSSREITVAGNPGVLVVPTLDSDGPGGHSGSDSFAMVMWQQDGVLRAVATSSEKKSRALAESMAK